MGKITKRLLIAAIICIAVGCVISIGAACGGGISEVREMMKNGGIHIGISGDDFADWNTNTEHRFSLEDISVPNLELKLGAGEFEIKESETTDILIKSGMPIKAQVDGDTIKIHTKDSVQFISWGSSGVISIEVPKGTHFGDVDMKIGAGKIECENVSAQKLSLEVGAGEIIMSESDTKEMAVNVGMGSFIFHGNVNGDIEMDCGMGNAQLWLDGTEEDYNYEIDCDMGNITVGNHSYGGVSAKQYIDNNAAYDIEMDCGMGNVELYFND